MGKTLVISEMQRTGHKAVDVVALAAEKLGLSAIDFLEDYARRERVAEATARAYIDAYRQSIGDGGLYIPFFVRQPINELGLLQKDCLGLEKPRTSSAPPAEAENKTKKRKHRGVQKRDVMRRH
jgi:hypothetical protein